MFAELNYSIYIMSWLFLEESEPKTLISEICVILISEICVQPVCRVLNFRLTFSTGFWSQFSFFDVISQTLSILNEREDLTTV